MLTFKTKPGGRGLGRILRTASISPSGRGRRAQLRHRKRFQDLRRRGCGQASSLRRAGPVLADLLLTRQFRSAIRR